MSKKSVALAKATPQGVLRNGLALALASLGLLSTTAPVKAATVTLGLEASYPRNAPFGMAYGDGFLWWQSSSNVIHQMTPSGIDTGVTATNPLGWSALGWESGQLVAAQNRQVTYFSPSTSAISKTTTISEPVTGILSLIDGLDIGPGGEIWYSPDVGNVYRLTADGTDSIPSGVNPFLGGAGGYSGVERIDVSTGTYVLVVNDASNPRRLCIHGLSGSEIGCTAFSNQRYEDLAYDGRYLWAADFYGDKIDKFCVQIDGGNCLSDSPTNVPGPLPLLGAAVALGYSRRLRQRVRLGHADETPVC